MVREKMGTKEFLKRAGAGSGKFLNWKKEGRTVGWIHPALGFLQRKIHGMIPTWVDKDGADILRRRKYICSEDQWCPMCQLQDFAKKLMERGVEKDITILDGGVDGGKIRLVDLAGDVGSDWRKTIWPKTETVFAWVVPTKDRGDEPITVMTEPMSVGKGLKRVIESAIDDYGEEDGDPLNKPYPFKLTFDEKEKEGSKMYNVERAGDKIAPMDDETQDILNMSAKETGIYLEEIVEPTPRKDILEGLESSWSDKGGVKFSEFLDYLGEDKKNQGDESPEDGEHLSSIGAEARGKKRGEDEEPMHKRKQDDDEEPPRRNRQREDEDEKPRGMTVSKRGDDEEEAPPKGKRLIRCPDCGAKVEADKRKCPKCMCTMPEDVPF